MPPQNRDKPKSRPEPKPEKLDGDGVDTRIGGRMQGRGDVYLTPVPVKTAPRHSRAATPYYEVYDSYKREAEEALNKETIPPAYKQQVKDYFESIQPEKKEKKDGDKE